MGVRFWVIESSLFHPYQNKGWKSVESVDTPIVSNSDFNAAAARRAVQKTYDFFLLNSNV